MGVRINTGSGIDPGLVEKLIEVERLPLKKIEEKKKKVNEDQKSYKDLTGLVAGLGTSLNGLRSKTDFVKLKLESSHPDILDGKVDNTAIPGAYEVEVKALAKTHKQLADAFPDRDETSVGFGYMTIELEDGKTIDVDIDPDASTLQDVARQINELQAGAKAIILNTKEKIENGDESFRLLVISEKSGKEAKVFVDPDMTYLEFKDQVIGRNLEMLFEDVPVFDEDNTAEAIMQGLTLDAKRAELGTKVTVKIDYDVEATAEGIKGFVDNYNKVNEFIQKQFELDPTTQKAGPLSRDNTLRTLRNTLQTSMQFLNNGKFRNVAEIGIITDSKSGALKLDDAKLKKALSEDYMGVAQLLVQSPTGQGIGTTLSDAVKGIQNNRDGVLPSKEREFKRLLENMDEEVVRKERQIGQKAEGIKRKFAALESTMSNMRGQSQAIAERLGGSAAPMPGLS